MINQNLCESQVHFSSFRKSFENHPCKDFWEKHIQSAKARFKVSSFIPYCRKWRICSFCHKRKFKEKQDSIINAVISQNLIILAVTISQQENSISSKFERFLRKLSGYVGFVKSREIQKGFKNVHYAVLFEGMSHRNRIRNYLIFRSNKEKVKNPVEVKLADVGWIEYCFKLNVDPKRIIPGKMQEKYSIVVSIDSAIIKTL